MKTRKNAITFSKVTSHSPGFGINFNNFGLMVKMIYGRDIPKPMVPVDGKPILLHQVELLVRYGIRDIVMITGHMSRVIEEYFGDGSRFGVRVRYYVEEIPLGTTGGIKMAESMLEDEFLVLYGDVMMDVDFGRMIEFH
ncbi:MAG TPA: nucleotidyltransferase family protein, partial [Spirochaetota bacterium]|nr:nucleotidyltransferase family protein [Spirochaetota bacterium]